MLPAELTERTNAAGSRYLSGWLGKAQIIGFWGDGEDRNGNATTVLCLFVQLPDQKPQERQERQPSRSPASAALANLNDPISY